MPSSVVCIVIHHNPPGYCLRRKNPRPPPPGGGGQRPKNRLCTYNRPQISGPFDKFHFLPEENFSKVGGGGSGLARAPYNPPPPPMWGHYAMACTPDRPRRRASRMDLLRTANLSQAKADTPIYDGQVRKQDQVPPTPADRASVRPRPDPPYPPIRMPP